ncbi:MAG: thermonuclease family protein [Hyphomicrobiales bacterium]|nr:thermonuclease family protein [Hyphomicrobiales bacterium]
MNPTYQYRAIVTKAYDADTVTMDIDLGLNSWLKDQTIRLFGINAPEMRGPEKADGKRARDYLRGRIIGREVIVETHKDKKGKYGRWLGTIYLDNVDINRALVEAGHAEYHDY